MQFTHSKVYTERKGHLKNTQSTKDYIYIDDLAAALLIVLEKNFRGIINLGTGIGLSVRKIAQTVALMMDKSELIEEANPPQVDSARLCSRQRFEIDRIGLATGTRS